VVLQYYSFGLYITDGRKVTVFRNKNLVPFQGTNDLQRRFFQGCNEWEPDSYLTSKQLMGEGKIKKQPK
jgi:hypothetical protein